MDVEQRAREMLAHVFSCDPEELSKDEVRAARAVLAYQAALTPPEGYVLVPVEWTSEMRGAFVNKTQGGMRNLDDGYAALIAARPEVPNVND